MLSYLINPPQPMTPVLRDDPSLSVLHQLSEAYGPVWPALSELWDTLPELYASGSRIAHGVLQDEEDSYAGCDLDLYLVSEDPQQGAAAMVTLLRALPEYTVEWGTRGSVARLTHPELPALGVVWYSEESMEEVLRHHDLTHLQVAWRPDTGLLMTDEFQTWLQTGVSVLTRDALCSRVQKYLARGVVIQATLERRALILESYNLDGTDSGREVGPPLYEALVTPPQETPLTYRPLPEWASLVWPTVFLEEQAPAAHDSALSFWTYVLLRLHPDSERLAYNRRSGEVVLIRDGTYWSGEGEQELYLVEEEPVPEPSAATRPVYQVRYVDVCDDRVYAVVDDGPTESRVVLLHHADPPRPLALAEGRLVPVLEDGELWFVLAHQGADYCFRYETTLDI